jgi:hypothetical protein
MVLQITEAKTCCHHWDIQPAHGPVSLGTCRNCWQTREFVNSIEDWSFDPSLGERTTVDPVLV